MQRNFINVTLWRANTALKYMPSQVQMKSIGEGSAAIKNMGSIRLSLATRDVPDGPFNWKNDLYFSLNPTQLAEVIITHEAGKSVAYEYTEKSTYGSEPMSGEPKVRGAQFMPSKDGGAIVSIKSGGNAASFDMSAAEFYVFKLNAQFSIPYLTGFHDVLDKPLPRPHDDTYSSPF